MAEKSGFFNALNVGGAYDRTYNANDYSDNLAVVIGNGVLRSTNDDLKVTANGMVATVGVGRAWINGRYYYNDTNLALAATVPPVGGSRYDRVVLRLDNSIGERRIKIVYVQGEAGNNPTKPVPTRTASIYELVLADIFVNANDTSISVTDTRSDNSICGWVYSTAGDGSFFTSLDREFEEWFNAKKDELGSVTLFKRYNWRTVLTSATNTIQFDIPQFDEDTCFIEVYVNGLLDTEGVEYTRSGNVLTGLGLPLVAGTEVEVKCYKSIDGTGIMSVADEITELQNTVATLDGVSKYTYKCTGLNDNISLSDIANAFCTGTYTEADLTPAAKAFLAGLGGKTYLSNLYPSAQITIEVVGRLGSTSPAGGFGTESSPYNWIITSPLVSSTDRKITFDFAKCEMITITTANNTYNSIFAGQQINIKNANVRIFSGAVNSNITMFRCINTGRNKVNVDGCYLEINASGTALVSDHGNFTNCDVYIVANAGSAYCFKPKSATFVRLNGGTYFAYGLTSSGIGSAIIHTSASDTDAVCIAQNIHCPVVTKTNYSQGFLAVANAGSTYIDVVVSRLTSSGDYCTVVGQIQKNKA